MVKRSRSTLFLMEQLIVIAVFSVCAAACVKILTVSYFTAHDTRDIGNAILAAENGAECFKAQSGDFTKIAEVLRGTLGSVDSRAAVIVYYDKAWLVCGEEDSAYIMRIVSREPGYGSGLEAGELSVIRVKDSQTALVEFPVAAAALR